MTKEFPLSPHSYFLFFFIPQNYLLHILRVAVSALIFIPINIIHMDVCSYFLYVLLW